MSYRLTAGIQVRAVSDNPANVGQRAATLQYASDSQAFPGSLRQANRYGPHSITDTNKKYIIPNRYVCVCIAGMIGINPEQIMIHVLTFCCILCRVKSMFLIRLNQYSSVTSITQ